MDAPAYPECMIPGHVATELAEGEAPPLVYGPASAKARAARLAELVAAAQAAAKAGKKPRAVPRAALVAHAMGCEACWARLRMPHGAEIAWPPHPAQWSAAVGTAVGPSAPTDQVPEN